MEELKSLFTCTLEKEKRTIGLFEVNKGIQMVYNEHICTLVNLTIHGQANEGDKTYTVCVTEYFYNSSETKLGITKAALIAKGQINTCKPLMAITQLQ